jgi:glutamyl-tRNA reductase
MALIAVGISYQTASIDIREKLTLGYAEAIETALWLTTEGGLREAVIISTCNRTELYCEADEGIDPMPLLLGHLQVSLELIQPYTYRYTDVEAAVHLMRVASGLDSMILGEAEILGQIKRAFTAAASKGVLGRCLGRLFQMTFAVAKDIRLQTGIGDRSVSVAYTAAKLSQRIFSDLSQTTVLLIGAGDFVRLLAQHLRVFGVQRMLFANRTEEHADQLAVEFKGKRISLEQIPKVLAETDMVITGTNSPLAILKKEMIEKALGQRKRKPIFMVDLSIPRNISPDIAALEDVYLYNIDDLQKIVEGNKQYRLEAVSVAENSIREAATQFFTWIEAQQYFKMLSLFRQKFEGIRDKVLAENLRRLRAGEDPEQILSRLAYHLTNRYLHEPTRRLREAAFEKEEVLLALTKDLFELEYEIVNTK